MSKKNLIDEALEIFDDDDIPDGAYFAMAADFAGVDESEVYDHLAMEALGGPHPPKVKCPVCSKGTRGLAQHTKDKHP